MKKQPLVLLDIDETVIGKDYCMNDPGLKAKVHSLQEAGWLVGLNSDTPIQRVNRSAHEWDCKGPLIVEYGAAIYESKFPIEGAIPPYDWPDQDPWLMRFDNITREFILFLRILHPNLPVFVGDPMIGLECIKRMPEVLTPWVVVNGWRRHSLSFFVRHLAPDGRLEADPILLRKLAEAAKNCYFAQPGTKTLPSVDPLLDINDDYGVCILHRPDASKRRAVPYLTEHYGPIVMVGNSMSDFLGDSRIVQCAVANASAEYKDVCSYVSPYDLTIGVQNCLDWVNQRVQIR